MASPCVVCGANLTAVPPPGMPLTCQYCGTAQPPQGGAGSPYGAAPAPYGAPPSPYGAPPSPYGAPSNPYAPAPSPYGPAPGTGGPPEAFGMPAGGFGNAPVPTFDPSGNVAGPPRSSSALPAIVILLIVGTAVTGGVLSARHKVTSGLASPTTATGTGTGMPITDLRILKLDETPEMMTRVTGVVAKHSGSETDMEVPLRGGAFNRMRISWDKSDPSSAKEVYLYADTPPSTDADIRKRIAAAVPRRVDANNNLFYNGVYFSYGMTSARAAAEPTVGATPNPHWKQQVGAAWDLLREAVLGLPVTVTDADKRDWLGGGYTLAALGAIDTTVDVDHSTAMMSAAFPGVATQQSIGLEHTIAIDHPWFGEAELQWANEKAGAFSEVYLRPPADAHNAFANQQAIDACVQGILGGKPRHYDEDHLKGTYDDEWHGPEGGAVRVYGHMVDVMLVSHFTSKKMSRDGFRKLMLGLDACGKGK